MGEEETVELWRPTGPEEIELVRASGSRRWPPRLPDQPIFYPVLNEDYATRIARDWNVKASGVGYVTRFRVRKSFLDRYGVQQVGGETILEYWIPAEDLEEMDLGAARARVVEIALVQDEDVPGHGDPPLTGARRGAPPGDTRRSTGPPG